MNASPKSVAFMIEDVIQGLDTKPVHYRIRVGQRIKYLRGPKPLSTLPDQSGDKLCFQTVADGEWNLGTMEVGSDGRYMLVSTENRQLPDLMAVWHRGRFDLGDLGYPTEVPMDSSGERFEFPLQLRGHMPSGVFETDKAMEKAVVALWNYDLEGSYSGALANESYIYSLLQGQTIAPQFLGHLTENNSRTIGYVLESVEARQAEMMDFEGCREALQQLHNLGIVHGGINRESFLIKNDSKALLQNLFNSFRSSDQAIKRRR
jgi:hypothetical protein